MSPELILALLVIAGLIIAYWNKCSELADYKKIGDRLAKDNAEMKKILGRWGSDRG